MSYESESLLINGDPNDILGSANLLRDGAWMRGSLASAGDVDYFKFTAVAGLVTLDFSSSFTYTTQRWRVDLLDANGDLLRTLGGSITGSPTATAVVSKPTQVVIAGLTSAVSVGDQFTLGTSGSDLDVYTVVSVDSRATNAYTVTLDKAYGGTAGGAIVFSPAFLLSTGSTQTLQALLPADGTYYVRVTSIGWSDADYQLRTSVQGSAEVALNDNITDASSENSRLVAGLTHAGTMSSSSDVDVWLLTTATGSTFSLDFTGANSDSKFLISIQVYNAQGVLTDARSPGGAVLGGQVTGSRSFTVDSSVYPTGTTFVVSVSSDGLAAGTGTGAYTLKASGTSLDLNDAPVIHVAGYSSPAVPNQSVDLTGEVVRSYRADATSKVALSTLFSATDADAGQSLKYQVWLQPAAGSPAVGLLKLEPAQGSPAPYGNGTLLTQEQLATAYLYPGTALGDLVLRVQAVDSTGALDESGRSAYVSQTIRVVSESVALAAALSGSDTLVEGTTVGDTGYSRTLTLTLATPPSDPVTVNLVEPAGQTQFVLSRSSVTFDAGTLEQVITIRARDDGLVEGPHTGTLTFVVTSADPDYNQLVVSPLTLDLADASNRLPTGTVSLPTGDVSQGTTITVDTSQLDDPDGLGLLNYVWQRGSGEAWTDIAGATSASYRPVAADAGLSLRVRVTYVDAGGTQESVLSTVTTPVIKTNEAPTSADQLLRIPVAAEPRTFSVADFPFTDGDTSDTLGSVYLYSLPETGTLRFDGLAISVGQGFRIIAADLGKLAYTPVADAVAGSTVSFDFAVSDRQDELSAQQTMTLRLSTPPASSSGQANLVEDSTGQVLGTSVFAFSDADAGDTLQAVRIMSLPTGGKLLLDGAEVTSLTQVISITAADITAGKLTYRPAADANGTFTLGFQVFDGGLYSTTQTLTLNVTAVNDLPTGSVTIGGTAEQGQVLTASDTLADADGLGTFSYQWQVADTSSGPWTNIGSATASTFTLTQAQVGKVVRVQVSYTDPGTRLETVNSAATTAVLNINDAPVTADATQTMLEDAGAVTLATSLFAFSDVDPSDTLQAVSITSLPSRGKLLLDGVEVTNLSQVASVSMTAIAANKLAYRPAANDAGAFTLGFKVFDGVALSAAKALTLSVTAVNDAPSLTALTGRVDKTTRDTPVEVTLAELAAQGNEADVDGPVTGFVVKAVSSGTLRIGFSSGEATTWAEGSNDVIDATHQAYWTPATGANGRIGAFTVVARDGAGATSTTPVQALVDVGALRLQAGPSVGELADTTLSQGQASVPAGMPGDFTDVFGLLEASATVSAGGTAHFRLTVESATAVNGLWQHTDTGWVNLAGPATGGTVTAGLGSTELAFSIKDGSAADADPASGSVGLEAVTGHLQLSIVGLSQSPPESGFWF